MVGGGPWKPELLREALREEAALPQHRVHLMSNVMCVCMCIYIYIYIIYIYTYIHTHMYMCIYTHVIIIIVAYSSNK